MESITFSGTTILAIRPIRGSSSTRIHGGIGFYPKNDELYWNIFSGYDVPVDQVSATVRLPAIVPKYQISVTAYRNGSTQPGLIIDGATVNITRCSGFIPGEPYTVGVDFPKGLVSQFAYFLDFRRIYATVLLVCPDLVILALILGMVAYLTFQHGPIAPSPRSGPGDVPENMSPAIAALIYRGRITSAVWAATIADLARRGYVRVQEEPGLSMNRNVGLPVVLGFWLGIMFMAGSKYAWVVILLAVFAVTFLLVYIFRPEYLLFQKYSVIKAKEFEDNKDLKKHEYLLLAALFKRGDQFFLADNKHRTQTIDLSRRMGAIRHTLYREVRDYGVFSMDLLDRENLLKGIGQVTIILLVIGFLLLVAHERAAFQCRPRMDIHWHRRGIVIRGILYFRESIGYIHE